MQAVTRCRDLVVIASTNGEELSAKMRRVTTLRRYIRT
jgi:hypothetical protein